MKRICVNLRQLTNLSLWLVLVVSALCQADIYNGDFEIEDPCLPERYSTPDGWICLGYAQRAETFVPSTGGGGNVNSWEMDTASGMFAFGNDNFLLISTEHTSGPGEYRSGGILEGNKVKAIQEITVEAGQMIQGMYFFGTCDYSPYEDTAEIILTPINDSNLHQIEIAHAQVEDVGNFSSTLGWQRFGYVFDANETGTYNLTVAIWDYDDAAFYSYFAVDALSLCDTPVTNSDINLDCKVNFLDFSYLANDWLIDCNDINTNWVCDPNAGGCFIGISLDDSNFVDSDDLTILTQDWLDGL